MKLLSAAAGAAAVLFLSTEAAATTVLDFDDLAEAGSGYREISDNRGAFAYGGFVFQSDYGAQGFRSFRSEDHRNADPGGAAIFHTWDRTWMHVSKSDGSVFDLISMDVADLLNTGASVDNQFRFTSADGRVESVAFTTDNVAGLQTLVLNRGGLKSFSMAATASGWWQLDNITLGTPVSAVPEPNTWAMMILGFGGLGVMLRRTRRTLQPA